MVRLPTRVLRVHVPDRLLEVAVLRRAGRVGAVDQFVGRAVHVGVRRPVRLLAGDEDELVRRPQRIPVLVVRAVVRERQEAEARCVRLGGSDRRPTRCRGAPWSMPWRMELPSDEWSVWTWVSPAIHVPVGTPVVRIGPVHARAVTPGPVAPGRRRGVHDGVEEVLAVGPVALASTGRGTVICLGGAVPAQRNRSPRRAGGGAASMRAFFVAYPLGGDVPEMLLDEARRELVVQKAGGSQYAIVQGTLSPS